MLQKLKLFLTLNAPDWFFIPLINFSNARCHRNAVVHKFEKDVYAVTDGGKTAYSPRRSRLRRYFFGIDKQCDLLSQSYMMHKVPFKDGDILIDCGANNGEIGIWAKTKNLKYYAFEPESLESRCCDLNNFDGQPKTIRKGLWHEKTTLTWYSKPESADSSLIEIAETEGTVSIETTTLNDFVSDNNIDRIRLFKLEAEGAEPEVLQGALKVLNKIDYIAVDCGYERGIKKQHTFIEVYNILKDNQFDIVAAEFRRIVFLFKRRDA